jgi:galactokinase
MNESCRSSIEHYECGVQAICDLQQVVSSADGVLGSRFMGGGFGGCVVGLVKPSRAVVAIEDIQAAYRKLHPEVADQAAVYLAQSDDGVRFL